MTAIPGWRPSLVAALDEWPGEESNLACRRGEVPRSASPCSGSCRMSTGQDNCRRMDGPSP